MASCRNQTIFPIFVHMTIGSNTALVLEGGGLRGVFTCGVLDYFMDNGIRFPFTVGVSAGACNGLSYMSGQRGRAKASNIDLMEKDTAKLAALYQEGYDIASYPK